MPDLAWLRTCWSPTRKPLIDGFGLMCSGGRTLLSPKPGVPSLINKKAVGDPEGLAELMVFYCERSAGFSSDIASDDEAYFNALVRMFEQALKIANALSVERRDNLLTRLDSVRLIGHKIGYGVGDDMDFLMSKFTQKRQ